MKKKGFLFLTCLLCLSACGRTGEKVDIQESAKEQESVTEALLEGETVISKEQETTENGSDIKEVMQGTVLHAGGDLYLAQPDGQTEEIFVSTDEEYVHSVAKTEEGIFYVKQSYQGDSCVFQVIKYTETAGNVVIDEFTESAASSIHLGYYQGCVYLTESEYMDGGQTYKVFTYEPVEEGYHKSEISNDLCSKIYQNDNREVGAYNCYTMLEEYGKIYMVSVAENAILVYDSEGEEIDRYDLGINDLVAYQSWMDEEQIIVESVVYDSEDYSSETTLYRLDLLTKEVKTIEAVPKESAVPLGLLDGKLIYYVYEEIGYSKQQYHLHACDTQSGENELLISFSDETAAIQQKVGMFYEAAMEHGKIYFTTIDYQGEWWNYYDLYDGTGVIHPVVELVHNTFSDYGTMVEISNTLKPEGSDVDRFGYCVEIFQLTKQYPGTDKINSFLQENGDQLAMNFEEEGQSIVSDTSYEDWGYQTYWGTQDYNFKDIKEIGTHYLSISAVGYEYWGGAHGYPYKNEFLFDTNTGERVTLQDLYSETEEAFRETVAEYSVLHYEENSDQYFGFESLESAKEAFYENADLNLTVSFEETGIMVCYEPYLFGPYSSGYIEVPIPYEALGISLE